MSYHFVGRKAVRTARISPTTGGKRSVKVAWAGASAHWLKNVESTNEKDNESRWIRGEKNLKSKSSHLSLSLSKPLLWAMEAFLQTSALKCYYAYVKPLSVSGSCEKAWYWWLKTCTGNFPQWELILLSRFLASPYIVAMLGVMSLI